MKQFKTTITLSLLLLSACYNFVNGQSDIKILQALPHTLHGDKIRGAQPEYTVSEIALTDLKEMDRRKYVVLQCEPDAEVMKDLSSKPDLLIAYKTGINNINDNLKAVLAKFWKICPDSNLIYLTAKQFNTYSDKENYLVVFCYASSCYSELMSYRLPLFNSDIKYSAPRMKEYLNKKKDIENQVFFAIEKPEDNTIVYSRAMPDMFPGKAELAMAVTDASIKYKVYKTFLPTDINDMGSAKYWLYAVHKNSTVDLTAKTLLINTDWINSTKLTSAEIKKNYPYPFKLIASAELDEYIMNQIPGYFFQYPDVVMTTYGPNDNENSLGIHISNSIIDVTDFSTTIPNLTTHSIDQSIELTTDDIKRWVDSARVKRMVAPDAQKYPDYAGFFIPRMFSYKENAPNNVFRCKNTPLDSCLVTFNYVENDHLKVISKYYNSPSASWDGKVDYSSQRPTGCVVAIKGIAGNSTYYYVRTKLDIVK